MTVEPRVTTYLLFAFLVPAAAGAQPGRPARLAIDPNAIVRDGQPLTIEIEGVPEKQSARIWVVRDCNRDGRPEDDADCLRLYDGETEPADRRNVVDHQLKFLVPEGDKTHVRLDVPGKEVLLPRGVRLWLRTSRDGSAPFLQATFGFVEDECTIFETVVDVFAGGRCGPGLAQVLRKHRQPTDLANTIFEARRIVTDDESAEPVVVPGTLGASGVAWLDQETLLVTSSGAAEEGALEAGLYRVPLTDGSKAERLWQPEESAEEGAVAPFGLSCERVVFVTQKPGAQQSGANPEVAWLVVLNLKSRKVETKIPLPYKVHQLVAADSKGLSVLALSLGVADNLPVFMKVALDEGAEPEVVGFSNALYESLMRDPGGEVSAVAFENAYADLGWQIDLAKGREVIRSLVKRDGMHDLAPSWRPRGGELVYLAQVGGLR